MRDLLLSLLNAPDSHGDPYVWGAVFLAHAAIGLVAFACLAWIAGRRAGLAIALAAYAAWEARHAVIGGDVADSLTDLAAFGIGAMLAFAAWDRRGRLVAALLLALVLGLWRGVLRRGRAPDRAGGQRARKRPLNPCLSLRLQNRSAANFGVKHCRTCCHATPA